MIVDVIEWGWTLVNGVGVVLLGLVIRDLWIDKSATAPAMLTALGLSNGRRGLFVGTLLRHEALFLFFQGLFLLSGIAALRRPNLTDPVAVEGTVIAGAMAIIFALCMDIITLLDIRDRQRIQNYSE